MAVCEKLKAEVVACKYQDGDHIYVNFSLSFSFMYVLEGELETKEN